MVEIASYGPWAVVTGASSGIGRAFAEHLAAAGLDLVLAARSTDRLESLGSALSHTHDIAYRVVTADLSTPDGAAAVIEATDDLDVGLLVSNAGSGRPGLLLDQELDDLRRRLVLNATTHLELAHALGEALHYELEPAGVEVMVMLPGNVDTPIIDAFGVDRAAMPIRPQPADSAVRETVAAFLKRRPMHIPGRAMRMMTRLIPRSRSVRLNGRMLGQAARNLAERDSALAAEPASSQ